MISSLILAVGLFRTFMGTKMENREESKQKQIDSIDLIIHMQQIYHKERPTPEKTPIEK